MNVAVIYFGKDRILMVLIQWIRHDFQKSIKKKKKNINIQNDTRSLNLSWVTSVSGVMSQFFASIILLSTLLLITTEEKISGGPDCSFKCMIGRKIVIIFKWLHPKAKINFWMHTKLHVVFDHCNLVSLFLVCQSGMWNSFIKILKAHNLAVI